MPLLIAIPLLSFSACASIPKGAEAVTPFDVNKYLGVWYEIARIDFRFEKDMNNVTATYSLSDENTIKVENRGYNYVLKEWKDAVGKARFVKEKDVAKLKVSFFGPFYSGYNVLALDPGYKYALISGKSLKYLWILSREKTIPEEIKASYLDLAKKIGYDVNSLTWTEHNSQ